MKLCCMHAPVYMRCIEMCGVVGRGVVMSYEREKQNRRGRCVFVSHMFTRVETTSTLYQ